MTSLFFRGLCLSFFVCLLGCEGQIAWQNTYWPTPPQRWQMHSVNNLTGGTSETTIEILPQTLWHNYPVIPWVFTKAGIDGWFGPGAALGLRWYLAVPDAHVGGAPFADGFLYGIGHEVIDLATGAIIQDDAYHSTSIWPAYLLAPKMDYLPFLIKNDGGQRVSVSGVGTLFPLGTIQANPVYQPSLPGTVVPCSWWVKGQKRQRPTEDLVQLDYYEACGDEHARGVGIETSSSLLRESWYFKAGVGLMEVRDLRRSGGIPYRDEAGYRAEEITEPDTLTRRIP